MSSPRTHNHVHLWPDACTHISRHLSLLYFGSLSSGPHCTKTNSHIRAIVIVIVLKDVNIECCSQRKLSRDSMCLQFLLCLLCNCDFIRLLCPSRPMRKRKWSMTSCINKNIFSTHQVTLCLPVLQRMKDHN